MATREMIRKKFGIIYTCNCGWLDRAHSYPFSSRPGVGVDHLIKTIAHERGMQDTIRSQQGFVVAYGQDAVKSSGPIKVYPGIRNHYVVRKGLSNAQKLQVALGIFVDVSLQFEGAQNSWLARTLTGTDSGFSEEDLVSDLIGFYKPLNPNVDVDKLCRPVSVEASRRVWDRDGPVGQNKNKSFTPRFHKCDECTEPPKFPQQFQMVAPAKKGELLSLTLFHRSPTTLYRESSAVKSLTARTSPDSRSGDGKRSAGALDARREYPGAGHEQSYQATS